MDFSPLLFIVIIMKKYAVFSESKKAIAFQLSISNKIIIKKIKNGEPQVVTNIINTWLADIMICNLVAVYDGKEFSIKNTATTSTYKAEIVNGDSNIKVNVFSYEWKYTTKRVD